MTVPRPTRRPAGTRLAVAALAALALAGCSELSPQTTQNVTYAPSDGVQGDIGELKVRNVMVLTAEQGAPAEVVAAVFNGSGEDVSLEVVVREPVPAGEVATGDPLASQTITLEGSQNIRIGPADDEQVSIDELDVVPGRVVQVTFIGAGGSLDLSVPVLDGTLSEYAALIDDEA